MKFKINFKLHKLKDLFRSKKKTGRVLSEVVGLDKILKKENDAQDGRLNDRDVRKDDREKYRG